jgi:porphobilinogen synthase
MHTFHQYRTDQQTRDYYAEVTIRPGDFIYPYFVVEGIQQKQAIASLDEVYRFSIDHLLIDIEQAQKLGINKILLFGVIDGQLKDELGTQAYAEDNLVSKSIKKIKAKFPEITIFTDVCLCGYTSHGHCGLLNSEKIDNQATLPLLANMALQHALAGADFVAPSAMMDGQVESLRQKLDEQLLKTRILSYSAKYSSSFYGPFRDAANSAPSFGDRKTYQMDYRTIHQGINEATADIEEGADWIMVKPAHTYLDMIQRIKVANPAVPMVAYQVSGEYMMIKAAAKAGYLNEDAAMLEALTAIKRAGANYIISYYAKKFVEKSFSGS